MTTAVDKNRKLYERLHGLLSFGANYAKHLRYVNEYLAELYEIPAMDKVPEKDLIRLTSLILTALQDEVCEVLGELPWKPWKSSYNDPKNIDVEKIREEIVDVQHFVNNLIMIWFDDLDQFHCYFRAKLDENVRRQEEGY